MAFLRVCLSAALLAFGAAVEAPDEVSFVQRAVRVQDDEQLEPSLATPLATLAGTRQLPFQIPGNVSMQDIMQIMTEVMTAFRDRDLVRMLYSSIRNVSKLIVNFSTNLANAAHNLSIDTENASTGRSFFLLEQFFLNEIRALAHMAADSMADLKVLIARLPNGSTVRTMAERGLEKQGLLPLTTDEVYKKVDGELRPKAKEALGNSTEFCGKFMRLMGKVASVETTLSTDVIPNLAQVSTFMPGVGSLLGNIAPDVEPEITRFANLSLSVITKLLMSGRASLHIAIKSVSEVSEAQLNCSLASVLPQLEWGGARASGANLLLPLLAVMAAWWRSC